MRLVSQFRIVSRAGTLYRSAVIVAIVAITCGVVFGQSFTEKILHNFGAAPKGADPEATLFRDAAGTIYGTTPAGGAFDQGIVFKLDGAGLKVLYSFRGTTDGGVPTAGVVGDALGNLYGTTTSGGVVGKGTIYEINGAGHYSLLYSFAGGLDGATPSGGLILDNAGNLYGATYSGGAAGLGVIFKLDPSGKETILYAFKGGTDGANPQGSLTQGAAGELYGTTPYGGTANLGVVFKLDSSGKETVLHTFTGFDGASPYCTLIRDDAGNLYGTTTYGGATFGGGLDGFGTVFEVTAAGEESVLYSFNEVTNGGVQPQGHLFRDAAGTIYGTTGEGGQYFDDGVVFQVDAAGAETVLHNFTGGTDGGVPIGGLIGDAAGNLFGTTEQGGSANGGGLLFKINAAGKETVLYNFSKLVNGKNPAAALAYAANGKLYGTTELGGAAGNGIVYKVDSDGYESVLFNFTGGADGGHPLANVITDGAGNLYGITYGGGTGYGTVFRLNATGQESVLHSFSGGVDGSSPEGGVVRDTAGNLYGTTTYGGAAEAGVVFKIDTEGNESVLYTFSGGADGSQPNAGVALDAAGNLYGTTSGGGANGVGAVYRLDAAGNETVLHSFSGSDGNFPRAGLILDSEGNIFGSAGGGAYNAGVVFKLDPSGHQTVLYAFTGLADGGNPNAVIVDDVDNVYGTCSSGGDYNKGLVFQIAPSGGYAVLLTFPGGLRGARPYSGLAIDPSRNLYGTTYGGGTNTDGIVFELKPE